MSNPNQLPSYQPRLEAFHRAFAAELRAIIRSLPINPQMHVLDVGCGDGFYDQLIAERLSQSGSITGLDNSPAYLELARRTVTGNGSCQVRFIEKKLEEIGDSPQKWDLVWCAQSLYSLPEPVSALSQMARAVRPGGFVVVLENDTMHELLMPWPVHLEIALRSAELAKFAEPNNEPNKYYVGRRLPSVFAEAGLEPLFFRTQCIDRQAPLDPDTAEFLRLYLAELLESTKSRLKQDVWHELEQLVNPESPKYLPRQPHFTMSWLNVLAWGRK